MTYRNEFKRSYYPDYPELNIDIWEPYLKWTLYKYLSFFNRLIKYLFFYLLSYINKFNIITLLKRLCGGPKNYLKYFNAADRSEADGQKMPIISIKRGTKFLTARINNTMVFSKIECKIEKRTIKNKSFELSN